MAKPNSNSNTGSTLFCSGNIGANILEDGDFGSGTANIPPVDPGLAPGYIYQLNPPPDDGFYNITNNTTNWGSFANIWIDIGDNSPDPNGYMMVVNANFEPGVFFERTIDICDNAVYEFSADVINLVEPSVQGYILPNMDFLINGEVLFSTGDIPQNATWQTVGFTFDVEPGTTEITLTLRNNAPGGFGNDLALDNISFRPCGPDASVDFTASCEDGTATLTAIVNDSETMTTVIQWQESADGGVTWQDIANETAMILALSNPIEGYQYRYLMASSAASLASPTCRIISDAYTIMAVAPVSSLTEASICAGESFSFGAMNYDEAGTYADTLQTTEGCDSIAILMLELEEEVTISIQERICSGESLNVGNLTYTEAGSYLDTLISSTGCDSILMIELEVELLEAETVFTPPTCFGDRDATLSVLLSDASTGSYSFSLNGENPQSFPEFTALNAGAYSIMIESTTGCVYTEDVFIPEPEEVNVSLGEDILISLSDSVQLQAAVNFDPAVIRWTPEDNLSCTDCLSPFVNPKRTTAYQVYVENANGCSATAMLTIFVEKSRAVYIPNAFSPNGDGVNDRFTIFSDNEVEEIRSLQIFDRWGELLFSDESFVPNSMTEGWDGQFRGKALSNGVYIYLAEVQFIDGETVLYSGDVTLIR